jgi:hypothetical protein
MLHIRYYAGVVAGSQVRRRQREPHASTGRWSDPLPARYREPTPLSLTALFARIKAADDL